VGKIRHTRNQDQIANRIECKRHGHPPNRNI
jgi:hypothetical protein